MRINGIEERLPQRLMSMLAERIEARLRRKPSSYKSMNRLFIMVLGFFLLVALVLLLLQFPENSLKTFLPSREAIYNFEIVKAPQGLRPGHVEIQGLSQLPPEQNLETKEEAESTPSIFPEENKAIQESNPGSIQEKPTEEGSGSYFEHYLQKAAQKGLNLSPRLAAQLKELDKLQHDKLLDVKVHFDIDTSAMGLDESIAAKAEARTHDSLNQHLKQEFYTAERRPLPEADLKKGPFYRPFQMETPWIAFDQLFKDVAETSPQRFEAFDNGGAYCAGDQEEVVQEYRGRVFSNSGLLWSLRQQPLRGGSYHFQGKEYQHAYYGVFVFLRKGTQADNHAWVNQACAFTTLTLPEELQPYVLKPGETIDQDYALIQQPVFVRVQGAYFRRIMYHEKTPEVDTSTQEDLRFDSEVYIPWLISQGVSVLQEPVGYPPKTELKAIVSEFSEDNLERVPSSLHRFDEAGYYLLLKSLQDSKSPLADLPEEELHFRKLLQQKYRDLYRGARVRVMGTLQSEYHPVVLPPNISGKRIVYRTYLLDALKRSQEDMKMQWFVDLLEPPLNYRGKAKVEVQGYYYRSQIFTGELQGRKSLFTFPLVVAKKLQPLSQEEFAQALEGDKPFNFFLIFGSLAILVIMSGLLVVLIRRENKKRRKLEESYLLPTRRKSLERGKNQNAQSGQSATPTSDQDS